MIYPTMSQVSEADQFQLAVWLRHLPSPGAHAAGGPNFEEVFEEENLVMTMITSRFRGWTPKLSKAVGW